MYCRVSDRENTTHCSKHKQYLDFSCEETKLLEVLLKVYLDDDILLPVKSKFCSCAF